MKNVFAVALLCLLASSSRAQSPRYALAVSTQANRGAATFLASTSVLTGNVYVFSSPAAAVDPNPAGIASVCYWLDRAVSAAPNHCESAKPYDLYGTLPCGTGSTCGGAWNTAGVTDGWHTLIQVVMLAAGGSETDTASFRTYNGSVLSLSAAYDDGSAVAGTVALQSLGATSGPSTLTTAPLIAGAANCKIILQLDTMYSVLLMKSDGTVLASFPFALPKILNLDPAALRSAAINVVFRRTDLTLKQVTPQVTFAF